MTKLAVATVPAQGLPLHRQLAAAAQALQAVRAGRSASQTLALLDAPWRPGVQALLYHVLRQLGRALALRELLARRPPPAAADALLLTALAWLALDATAAYDHFTLVCQAVEAARHGPAQAQAGFINACLRRFLREREALLERSDATPQAHWNYPDWWIRQVQQDHPNHWQAILQAGNRLPPMTLRVNLRQTTLADYQQRLTQAGLSAQRCGACGLQLDQAVPVARLPGFDTGCCSVQDAAAQRAAELLLQDQPDRRRLRILDACAAPGGKSAHLLEQADCELIALDIDAERCRRTEQTLARLGLTAQVLQADASQPATWWPQHCQSRRFDAILLDAPCTASGIVRRHPDLRWLRRPTDADQLGRQQAVLLDALWPLLEPGGRLLYCTCSVFRAEGIEPVQAFFARHSDAHPLPAPGYLLPGVPDHPVCDHDGFFYALLEKAWP